ncbi:MAG: hypothetical protein Tsb0020_35060 [Haliangiales bacterium]
MDDFEAHLNAILRSARIRGKLVVLCEGPRLAQRDVGRAPSPQTYRRQERLPDSSFYRRCIPHSWRDGLPRFFNCGDRSAVLRTYEALIERHRADPASSYLSLEKLYALVDLDVQAQSMPADYPFPDTELIHHDLYRAGRVTKDIDSRHRIWVTALIHKEAYFVLPPACRCVFDRPSAEQPSAPLLNGTPLTLAGFCEQAVSRIQPGRDESDQDLASHFATCSSRIEAFAAALNLNTDDHEQLAATMQAAHASANYHDDSCADLIAALFSVTKAKPIWRQISPPKDANGGLSDADYRDQLALVIATEISKLEDSDHPLARFFSYLKRRHESGGGGGSVSTAAP